jgi:ParB-like chromosome segregation protein Spo0J
MAYARRLAEVSSDLPPIIVHRSTMKIIDGTHRVQAALLKGREEIEVEFFDGSEDEAFVRAVELNTRHGRPLTMAERKLAAARIVASRPDLSDRALARISGLSGKTIAGIRRSAANGPQSNTRRGLDGRVHPVDSHEGRRRASQTIAARPNASLREVARLADVSVSTAKDVRDRLKRGEGPFPPERRKPAEIASLPSAPPPLMRSASTGRAPAGALQNISLILEKLSRDPSLRFSDDGREFLRLLQLQCTALERWPQLAEKLPDHCTGIVIQLARQCAEAWDDIAGTLPKRVTP